ncbi:MAG: hypothetical protein K9I94_04980 [Bacteroidales bacterium]|nr:hypothetical protein [Bacteroidales bacterium]
MFSAAEVESIFERFSRLKIMIIGDVMIDSYLWGYVSRISPEAPVPIVTVKNRSNLLGGAANVALNVKALGAEPVLCTVIGNDQKGDDFIDLVEEAGMSREGILRSDNRITTTKFRIIGNKSHMLRVDEETDTELNTDECQAFFEKIEGLIDNNGIDAIIFQDYDKGIINANLITRISEKALSKNIPVTADPKKRNFNSYKNITLFKPNLKELKEGLHLNFNSGEHFELSQAIRMIQDNQNIVTVLTTLSENGVFIRSRNEDESIEEFHIPAHVRDIADVSGAGDTVISVAALCLALKLNSRSIAELSNLAGGLVCEHIGVVPVSKEALKKEALQLKPHDE